MFECNWVPRRGTLSRTTKNITHEKKNTSPLPLQKVCDANKPILSAFRGHIDDQYSSKHNTFSPRISGDMMSAM